MIQKWVGIGRIGHDAENLTMQSGNVFIKFSIAVDDPYQDKNGNWIDRSYWIPVEMQNPSLVEYYNGRLTKGTLIWIEGKLVTYKLNNTQNGGNPVTKFTIVASGARIISRPQNQQQKYNNNQNTNYQQSNNYNAMPNNNYNPSQNSNNYNAPPNNNFNTPSSPNVTTTTTTTNNAPQKPQFPQNLQQPSESDILF